jgi:hypothetical protein
MNAFSVGVGRAETLEKFDVGGNLIKALLQT